MIAAFRRRMSAYRGLAAMTVKRLLAYPLGFWANTLSEIVIITVTASFWRAVYADTEIIGGLIASQTINYVLVALLFAPTTRRTLVGDIGLLLRDGGVAAELLRPVDFQERMYVEHMAGFGLHLIRSSLPQGIFAWLVFHLRLPADPAVWASFAVAMLLGQSVLFCFDWIFSALAFYTTETWGLYVVREAVTALFSGLLIPLVMLPGWLQKVAAALPFAQGLYAPVGLLTGVIPVSQAPRIWLGQALWLAGLALVSRLVFARAMRKVTVQGG